MLSRPMKGTGMLMRARFRGNPSSSRLHAEWEEVVYTGLFYIAVRHGRSL